MLLCLHSSGKLIFYLKYIYKFSLCFLMKSHVYPQKKSYMVPYVKLHYILHTK